MSARRLSWIPLLALGLCMVLAPAPTVKAGHTPDPVSVTVAGSLQDELGCPGDWQPDCSDTFLTFDAEDGVWQQVFALPAGSFEYKAALNGSWSENYGLNAQRDGANIPLDLAAAGDVKFYYSHETHWITDNVSSVIAVAPGDFQSELGCSGDWDPSCLRSWLQDPDGDGIYSFTAVLPAGDYEAKVAHDESWNENYGQGGVQNGPNIPFNVPSDCAEMLFEYDPVTHILTIGVAPAPPQPGSVTIAGNFQEELGCPGDWQPDCANTHINFDGDDTVWQGSFTVPAGSWEYKAAIDNSWNENYGQNATPNGPNIALDLAADTGVKFYYDHGTHWVTDNVNDDIAVAPGSFQSELGCPGDWDPTCLRSWLQDPDGDGILEFSTRKLPAGNYEAKVAINESWNENYGQGGVPNGPNIPFTVPTSCAEIFFTYNETTKVLTIGTGPGGPKGNLNLAKAHWVTEDTLAWNPTAPADAVYELHYAADGGLGLDDTGVTGADGYLSLTLDPAGLPSAVTDKFPHLAGYAALKIDDSNLAMVPAILEGQFAASVEAADGTPIDATSVQIPGVLDDLYVYDGELGATFDTGVPTLRVWAPTAKSVTLHLFDDADPATSSTTYPMSEDASTGVWSVQGQADWDRKYYLYEVEVYAPSTGNVENNLVTDPYSLTLSMDSARTQIIDLDDPTLMPAGWHTLDKPGLRAPEDIVIYELHVRDFSIADDTVPQEYRGKFKAFTAAGSDGMRHLSALAGQGLTHLHLLPSFDITTVRENPADRSEPDQSVLATYPPDSDQQQAAIEAVKDEDGFNWGYDPWHYTVPEGSYSTDPNGPARVLEFREMVQALNEAGLRVVMDVVYNHTNAAGQNAKSVLDRIVPGYYHRLSLDGAIEQSSCCPNTASEHAMMEKLLIDSVLTWAGAYKVDGFRFDLMGHHMKSNMLKLRAELDALTMADDGVDGSSVYVYGEGWNFGEVANNARGENAVQANMAGTGIGTFSDRLRDGVRGGSPFTDPRVQGFINGLYYDSNGFPQGDELATLLHTSDWIRIGLAGDLAGYEFVDSNGNLVTADQVDYFGQQAGYTMDPQENITYIAAHDNETLFDATQLKTPTATTMEDRVRIQNLGNSIILLGQGIPFVHAGQDILRSKSMDRDSFNSGDWFNQIDWTLSSTNWGHGLPIAEKNQDKWPIMQPLLADPDLAPTPADIEAAADHFREMLRIRKGTPLFRLQQAGQVQSMVAFHNTGPSQIPGLIVMSITDDPGDVDRLIEWVVVLFNARDEAVTFTQSALTGLPLRLHPVLEASMDPVVGTSVFDRASGTFEVPARTTAVFQAKRGVIEQLMLVIRDVDDLVEQGVLNQGNGNALNSKLRNVIAKLYRGNEQAAVNQLGAFLNQVDAFERSGKLDAQQAHLLRYWVEVAIECIEEGDDAFAVPRARGATNGPQSVSDEVADRRPQRSVRDRVPRRR